MNKIKKLQILLFLLIITVSLFSEQKIVLSSLDWEPYIGASLPNQGFVAEIVREAFKREGYTVEIQFYPWARTVDMAKKGQVNGYFPEYYAKEIEDYAYFSKPFLGGPVVLFKRKADKISYAKLEDLKPYRIGVVRGYVNEEAFDKAGFLKKEEVTEDIGNISKLLNNRIDLFAADKYVGQYLINKNFSDKAKLIDIVEKPLTVQDLYVCFSKQAKDGQKLQKDFNSGLKKIQDDGTIKKILKKYGF